MKIFGREPAVWLGLFAAVLDLLTGFGLDASAEQQTLVNTVAAAAVAVASAVVMKSGALFATLTQFATAGFALFAGYGLDWGAEHQAQVLAVIATVGALWTRTQVQAPVSQVALEARSPLER